jgi:Skp family chaperone for outer membrane proteins
MSEPDWKLTVKKNVTAKQIEQEVAKYLRTDWIGSSNSPFLKYDQKYRPGMEVGKEQPTIKQVHAFLESHDSDKGLATIDGPATYAIIGCGFSATENRATLQNRDIGGSQIVHIGFPDPWDGYVKHNMNQAVELNTIPGYFHQEEITSNKYPDTTPQKRWLPSNVFADLTKEERNRFIKDGTDKLYKAGVVSITNEADHFLIQLNDDRPNEVKAQKVDILIGTGQQKILKPAAMETVKRNKKYSIEMPLSLWEEYINPRKTNTPRVVSAEMYVRNTCKPATGGLFCVTGASPASIQAMEHALCQDDGNSIDSPGSNKMQGGVMVNSAQVNGGFLPIGRLDEHARVEGLNGQLESLPKFRASPPSPTKKVYPSQDNVWFAEGYRIASIIYFTPELKAFFNEPIIGKLLVTFKESGSEISVVNNQKENAEDILYGMFDQVILGTGRLNDKAAKDNEITGSSFALVPGDVKNLEVINSDMDLPVGMQNGESEVLRVRILGAAGLNALKQIKPDDFKAIIDYENTLPAQARVNQEGVTLSGHTIAWANKFYTLTGEEEGAVKNNNINTVTPKELLMVCPNETFVSEVIATRSYRIGPFINAHQAIHAIAVYRHWTQRRIDNGLDEEFDAKQSSITRELKEINDSLKKLNTELKKLQNELKSAVDSSPIEENIKEKEKKIKAKETEKRSKEAENTQISVDLQDMIISCINYDKLLCQENIDLDLIYGDETGRANIEALTKQEKGYIEQLTFRPGYYIVNGENKLIASE